MSLRVDILPVLVAALTSCSVALNPNELQCESDEDCSARGADFAGTACVENVCQTSTVDPRWACLGQVVEPEPQPGVMHSYMVPIVEVNSQQPPAGLSVDVCNILNAGCTAPVATGLTPDANGLISFSVESGFDGYLDVTATGIVASQVFLGKPVVEDTVADAVLLVTDTDFNMLAMVAGFTIDPARGHALVVTRDCSGERAPGVSLSLDVADASTIGFFRIDTLPDPNAMASDADGSGGFINITPGFASVTGSLAEGGANIGVSRIIVGAATIAYVPVFPTP